MKIIVIHVHIVVIVTHTGQHMCVLRSSTDLLEPKKRNIILRASSCEVTHDRNLCVGPIK